MSLMAVEENAYMQPALSVSLWVTAVYEKAKIHIIDGKPSEQWKHCIPIIINKLQTYTLKMNLQGED